jgi:hypothetical protein
VPCRGLRNPERGTRRRHRTRPPLQAGAARAAGRAGPRGPLRLTVPHVADRRVATWAFGGPDRRTASSSAGPGAARPDVAGGGSAGAGSAPERPPRAPFTVRARGPAGPEPRAAALTAAGPVGPSQTKCSPASLTYPRRVSGRATVGPARAASRARTPGHVSSSLLGHRATLAGPVDGPGRTKSAGCQSTLGPGPASRVSQAAGGVLTGPRPAPAAGLGRAGLSRATRTTLPSDPRACG